MTTYALKHPGALTALFMYQLRLRMTGGAPKSMKDLYAVDPAHWAATAANLKEVRDQREVAVLTRVLSLMNDQKQAQAADVITQRVREVVFAKRPGGTWEKAELLSLLPSTAASSTMLPEGGMGIRARRFAVLARWRSAPWVLLG